VAVSIASDNADRFRRRLRETGLYVDLSDAFLAQTISPYPPEGRRMTPDEAAIEEIARRVVELLDDRTAGHCVRVSDLPLGLADGACARASRMVQSPDVVCLVTPTPTEPWHAEPTKVVEFRNAFERGESTGRLVIFIPAGQRVAAEDSFGRTTFEVVSFTDVFRSVVDRLLDEVERKDPDVAELASEVMEAVKSGRHRARMTVSRGVSCLTRGHTDKREPRRIAPVARSHSRRRACRPERDGA